MFAHVLENLHLQERKLEQEQRARELSLHASRSELKALRAQINPHFLFNALNSIAGLIHRDPAVADRTIEQLADVFRYALRGAESEWAVLDDELDFVRAYLEVERARFGERLQRRSACSTTRCAARGADDDRADAGRERGEARRRRRCAASASVRSQRATEIRPARRVGRRTTGPGFATRPTRRPPLGRRARRLWPASTSGSGSRATSDRTRRCRSIGRDGLTIVSVRCRSFARSRARAAPQRGRAMIRALIVDDEAPARDRLRRLLVVAETVDIVGEAEDGDGGDGADRRRCSRTSCSSTSRCPRSPGSRSRRACSAPRPRIVFCTAYDHFAIEAFELHAVDYLLKPVNRDRLGADRRADRGEIDEQRRPHARARRRRAHAAAADAGRPAAAGRVSICAGACEPADGVGGDYYDFLPLAGTGWAIALGDVSGKGMYAGLLAAALQARLQAITAHGSAVAGGRRCTELNRLTAGTIEGNRFATVFFGVVRSARRRAHLRERRASARGSCCPRPATRPARSTPRRRRRAGRADARVPESRHPARRPATCSPRSPTASRRRRRRTATSSGIEGVIADRSRGTPR